MTRVEVQRLPRLAIGVSRLYTRGRVSIESFDRGSGIPLVLLPGLGRSVSDFNELVLRLNTKGVRTIAIQLRGIGGSTGPLRPPPTLVDFADDAAFVVRSLEGLSDRRVQVLGRAFGNRIARTLAARYPDLVHGLVLCAAGGKVKPPASLLWKYAFFGSRWMPRPVRARAMESVLCAPGNRMPEFLAYASPLSALLRQVPAARRSRLSDWWHGGEAPMLVLQGEHDQIAPPSNAMALAEEYPDRVRVVMIPDAGHELIHEQPDLLCELILSRILGA